jgi:simple sugar transport system ATP-binding protein
MRRGRLVDEAEIADRSDDQLVQAMVGERVDRCSRREAMPLGPPRLVLRELRCGGLQPVRGVNLEIRRGEILGVAGVAGNGQWALAEAVAGLVAPASGDVLLDGESVARKGAHDAYLSPVAYVPEDPIRNAVVGELDLACNLALRTFSTNAPAPRATDVAERLKSFDVRPPEPARSAATLSGGNLQKLVAARELGGAPAAIVACYPTMGLDIKSTEALLARLAAHAADGAAILWIGEEIDDLLAVADRIAVIYAGRIVAFVDPAETDATEIGRHMTGHAEAAA